LDRNTVQDTPIVDGLDNMVVAHSRETQVKHDVRQSLRFHLLASEVISHRGSPVRK
jgi:hypothetical protein